MIVLPTGHILEFTIADIVYLKTDPEQKERMITGICLRPNKAVSYSVACSDREQWHFSIELQSEKTIF